jgi:hypothetical protein
MKLNLKPCSGAALAALLALLQPAPNLFATSVTNGLVVHLKFDGNLLDSTANHINGTNVAAGSVNHQGVTFATGFLGQAGHILVTADGTTNNYVTLGYPTLLKFGSDATSDATDFSFAMWLNIAASSGDQPYIGNKNWDSGGNLGWVVANEGDGMKINFTDDFNGRKDSAHVGPSLQDHNWHHLVTTFVRTGLCSIYLDGALIGTVSIAPNAGNPVGNVDTDGLANPPLPGGPDWAINLGQDGTGYYNTNDTTGIDLLMDDVGIWRRALTAGEVQEIYSKAAISGQTLEQEPLGILLPASYAMPAGSVDTNSPGFVARPYQTDAAGGGTLAWNENQQNGLYGPNIADLSGADANGYYTVSTVVNWNVSGGAVDTFPPGDPFPGIGTTGGTVNFSEQVLTYVEFPAAGSYTLGVNSDDGFGVTASILNPHDLSTAITLGSYDANRGSGDTWFPIVVQQAGIYPMRLLYFQSGGGGNLSWFRAITDATSTNLVLLNDTSTPGALKTYAKAFIAPPYATAFNFNPAGFSFVIQDDISALVPASLQVKLNGNIVTVGQNKVGTATTVTYAAPALFAPGTSNVVTATFSDNATPPHNLATKFTFIVPPYTLMPPTAAILPASVDTTARGLAMRISQIDSGAYGTLAANIAHAEAQLAGLLIDPAAGTPYPETVTPGPQPNGSYILTNINFSYDLTAEQGAFNTGNGYPDNNYPGLNGADSANMAGEVVAYLDLQAGFYTFAVNATDGFRVTTGSNPNDVFGTLLGLFDNRGITHEIQFGVAVQTAGIYPIRLVWFRTAKGANNSGDASFEFYTIDSLGKKILVNDASNVSAVKAYWKRTGAYGTYVKYAGPSSFVSPFIDSTDVGFTNASVLIADGSATQVSPGSAVWTVDGKVVASGGTAAGGVTKLTYNPTGPQIPRMSHTSTLTWTDAGTGGARRTNSWNFHLLRNYILPAPVYYEDFESTAAGPDPTVPTGWTQVNFTGSQTAGNDPNNLSSDFYLGWVVVDTSWNITKDIGVSAIAPQILNGVAFNESDNTLLVNHYIRAESDDRQNGPPGQIQYLYTKPYDLTGKSGIVIAFDSAYEQNQDNMNCLEYTVDGTNYYPVFYWVQGDYDSQAPPDIYRDALGNIDVTKTMTTTYGDVARYTDPTSQQLVGGYYGFFIKAPISPALAPYIEGRYNDDGRESKRFEAYRVPFADNQKSVVFRFVQAGTSSWYWAIDNWGIYSVPTLANPPGTVTIGHGSNGQLTLSWTGGGTLESATDVNGTWAPVQNASNPMTITPSGSHTYYRLHQ